MQVTQNSQYNAAEEQRRLTLSDFKTYFEAIVIKTVWHRNKDRHTDHWTRTESPEINPYVYSQLIFNKGTNTMQWGKIVFPTNMVMTTG